MIRNEPYEAKNKVVKSQGGRTNLTTKKKRENFTYNL
jgi:hypothetical protein